MGLWRWMGIDGSFNNSENEQSDLSLIYEFILYLVKKELF